MILMLLGVIVVVAGTAWLISRPNSVDPQLQANLPAPLHFGEPQDPNLIALGEALFFDKELSGNRDIACATCHHPTVAGIDGRSLPIGVGGVGLGKTRQMGTATELVPRNAPELFNRGSDAWETMFWDGRVAFHEAYDLESPADELLPDGLDNVLAAQALFPPTSRAEMRGATGENELGDIDDTDVVAIWDGIMDRLLAIPGYRELFATAYPELQADQWTIALVGNAIAAYEIDAFTFDDAPWDRYVAGDMEALSAEQKRGAALFFGDAGCSQCHNGPLLTDQSYHNIGVPHNGPGKNPMGIDFGRALVTETAEDNFKFRTPPLRNVVLTSPYMHNGYYDTLAEAIDHHYNAETILQTYPDMFADHQMASITSNTLLLRDMMGETLAPELDNMQALSDAQMNDLLAFLNALTSPTAVDLSFLTPDSVPSGLPVAD